MANINIEFDGKIYSVDENKLVPLASPLERALIQQLAGTGAVIRLGGTNYNVDANKLASARNVLTDYLGDVAGTDSKVTVAGTEYGLSKTKLQGATDKMHDTLSGMSEPVLEPSQGLEYQLNDDGVSYSVISIGECTDTDVVIPSMYNGLPVTELQTHKKWIDNKGQLVPRNIGTFSDYPELTSIVIPDSVTTIGFEAFYYCYNLTSVTIGSGVTTIEWEAFDECPNLTNVYIKDIANWCNVTFEFRSNPLMYASNLYLNQNLVTELIIPDGVTSIGAEAFLSCRNIMSVTIPDSVTSIGNYAFAYCDSLTSITIPDSVKSIGDDAFSGCSSLTSITLPNGITNIGDSTFYGAGLENITIPDSVTSIGGRAFCECYNLTTVQIGEQVAKIGPEAFMNCSVLTDILFKGTIAQWDAIPKSIYYMDGVPALYVQCTDGEASL